MAGGMGAGQALLLAASPFLTRLYTPADFGVLEVFHSLAASFGVVACLRYELALVIPRPESHARSLLGLCLRLALVIGALSGLGMLLLAAFGLGWNGVSWPELALPLVLAVSGGGLVLALGGMATRHERYALVSAGQFTRFAAMAGLQLGLYFVLRDAGGLVWGRALAEIAAALLLVLLTRSLLRGRRVRGLRLRALAKRYRQFPLFASPHALLNELSQGLPALILAMLFTGEAVGLFALAFRAVQVPTAFGRKVLQALLQGRLGERRRRGAPIAGYAALATLGLAAAGALGCLVAIRLAPDALALVFGEDWRGSGELARWIVPWMAAALANVPALVALQVTERQRFLLGYGIVVFVVRAAALFFGGALGDAETAVIALSLSGVAMNVGLIAVGLTLARAHCKGRLA